MSSYHADLSGAARRNEDFRRVLFTTKHTQLVAMTIPPGGEIGSEVHVGIDQVLIAVEGSGKSILDGEERPFVAGEVVIVPEGTRHNFVNTGPDPLRIATIYAPPDHAPGTVHHTRADADRDEYDQPPS
jgi:mannose-6-phosphate isomerase-like protein (cupin superfamily)